jgi:UrcA family protein
MNSFKSTSASSFRFAIIAAVGLLGSAQALADEPQSIKVSYADLDLSTQAGATTLYNRIRSAARTVCGYDDAPYGHFAFKRCFKQAVGDAVAKVNSPQLTALHQGTSPAVTAMR